MNIQFPGSKPVREGRGGRLRPARTAVLQHYHFYFLRQGTELYHLITGQVVEGLSQHPGKCGLCSMVRFVYCDDD